MKTFNENQILSDEDLLERLLRRSDTLRDDMNTFHNDVVKIVNEVIQRREMKEDYDKTAFRLKKRTTRHIFSVLQESGGSHRFTEILHFVRGSTSTLSGALRELRDMGLVRFEGDLYYASSPAWFAQKKREQKEKTKDASINRSNSP